MTLQPTFQVGDKVLLHNENIATTSLSRKLSSKFLGPFPVLSKISNLVYQLKLLKTLHIHNVFHVSLLERYCPDTILGRHKIPPMGISNGRFTKLWIQGSLGVGKNYNTSLHGRAMDQRSIPGNQQPT